ncbi:MAG: hypothetical protein HZA92_10760 [Verrucomicrobia bacterium]|nr:hypothetical protein [Verrucomicrobiota bacterium]
MRSRSSLQWPGPAFAVGFAALTSALAQPIAKPLPAAADPHIRVEISIPPAQTHVIGDATPLVWRFTNTSTQALAFMWEGCCRNNGKVEMRRQGPPPPAAGIVPSHSGPGPGIYSPKCDHCKQTRKLGEITVESTIAGPAIAHQFARAVRLAPGAGQEFPTLLSDWVRAEFTGDYKVRAQYLGVHPKQRPTMPRGVALWTGRTASTVLDLSLLSVADYLAERAAREATRQVRLELTGPAKLVAFQGTPLKLKLTNTSRAELRLDWPACLDLWIVASNGVRVLPASEPQLGAAETLVIPSGGAVERELAFSHELLVGEPFSAYQVFADLREITNALRVPSNPVAVTWQLDRDAVTRLVRDAADKPLTGARNAPLKLLRIYLGEIADPLRAVDIAALSPAAAKLTTDLRTSAGLKKLAPKPGRVDLSLSITPDGKFQFNEAAVAAAFADRALPAAGQLRAVLALRHHLGWDVGVGLKPEPATPLRHIVAALDAISPLQADLAATPSTPVFNADSTAFSTVSFQRAVIPANWLVRVSKNAGTVTLAAARRLPDPQRPGVEVMFSEAEIGRARFTDLPGAAALAALLADRQLTAPRLLVLAAPDLRWGELTAPLGPLINRSLPFDLLVQ